MKRAVCIVTLVSFVFAFLYQNVPRVNAQEQKVALAVLDLEARGGLSPGEAGSLTDRLRSELVELGAFDVLERGKMNEILKEQGFQQTGCTSSECVVEIGQILGVQRMVAGSVGKVGNVFTMDVRMFDMSSSKILKVFKIDQKGDISGLLAAMPNAARKLAELKEKKKKSKGWLWIALGTVTAGAAAAAVVLGGGKKTTTTEQTKLPEPPQFPQ